MEAARRTSAGEKKKKIGTLHACAALVPRRSYVRGFYRVTPRLRAPGTALPRARLFATRHTAHTATSALHARLQRAPCKQRAYSLREQRAGHCGRTVRSVTGVASISLQISNVHSSTHEVTWRLFRFERGSGGT